MVAKAYEVVRYRSPSLKILRSYAAYVPEPQHRIGEPIVFLHGSGECGDDIDRVATSHGPLYNAARLRRPFAIIVPQLPKRLNDDVKDWLNFADDLDVILRDVEGRYSVHCDRPYLTGISLGACGAWELGAAGLRQWLAIAAFAGGANDNSDPNAVAQGLTRIPAWAFVNRRECFPELVRDTEAMVSAIDKAGGTVRRTYFCNLIPRHNCWANAYIGRAISSVVQNGTPVPPQSIYDWFTQCSRGNKL